MKTVTLPSLRVEPALREAVERGRTRAEFVARGLASREEARRTGEFYSAREVHAELARMLDKAQAGLGGKTMPKGKAPG